jgi:hypothetical protein
MGLGMRKVVMLNPKFAAIMWCITLLMTAALVLHSVLAVKIIGAVAIVLTVIGVLT